MRKVSHLAVLLSGALVCGILPSSVTRGDERYFFDGADSFKIGQVPMAGDPSARPSMMDAWKKCVDKEKQYQQPSNEIDCDFMDIDGVHYMFAGDINNAKPFFVFGVKATLASGYRGHLLAGIAFGDSLTLVRRKLRRLPKDFPTWTFSQRDGEGAILRCDYAIANSHNDQAWAYRLEFDLSDRLISVSTEYDTNVD